MSLVPAGVAKGVDGEVVEVEEDAEVVLVQIMRGHRIKA
jgi:ribosomal protein L24